jgi:hypothetical protein
MERIKNNIQLVSIHIPKTAGTSFRSILVENLGAKNFAKLDIYNSGRIKVDDQNFTRAHLNSKITAVHGHCSYSNLLKQFELNADVVFLTWLRNPLNRVLSNYYFLKDVIVQRMQEQEDENLMNRMVKSLEEFVSLEENQNVMTKFLEGAPLETFKFIGIQDDFENELTRLERTMGWKALENRMHNVTKNKENQLTQGVIELIKEVNQKDFELFEYAIALNNSKI